MKNFNKYKNTLLQILVVVCFIFNTNISYSQDSLSILEKKISLNIKNNNLYEALNQISIKTGYNFSYNSKLISENRKIQIKVNNLPVKDVLNKLLQDSTLSYLIVSNQIVILKQLNNNLTKNKNNTDTISYIQIGGKIIDKVSYLPLAYANICIEEMPIGTVSNFDGEFILKIPNNYCDTNLIVSYVGYENLQIPIKKLTTFENLLMLKPNIVPIQEVIIRNSNPLSLLKLTLNEIPNNYSTKPAYLTSFYRETIKRNNKYAAVLEAVVDIYKTSYSSNINDKIKITKSRKNIDYNIMDTIMLKIKGGLRTSMILDIVKSKPNFIDDEYINLYNYKISDIIDINRDLTYVISFEPKKYSSDEVLYNGDIYIDIKTLVIKKVEFWLNQESIKKSGHLLVVKQSRNTIVKPIKAHYITNYREYNGKNYLSYINGNIIFKIREKGKLFSNQFNTSIELAVTKIDTSDVRKIKFKNLSNTSTILFDEIHNYKNSFWEEYNFIKPEESLLEAIQKMYNSN